MSFEVRVPVDPNEKERYWLIYGRENPSIPYIIPSNCYEENIGSDIFNSYWTLAWELHEFLIERNIRYSLIYRPDANAAEKWCISFPTKQDYLLWKLYWIDNIDILKGT